MSTDWNVHCLDCKVTHTFDDANHQDGLMLTLCKHADTIALLAEVTSADRDIELRTPWGAIDAAWFRTHLGHNLVPIDEYGRVLGVCHELVSCGECRVSHHCVLEAGHDPPHSRTPR